MANVCMCMHACTYMHTPSHTHTPLHIYMQVMDGYHKVLEAAVRVVQNAADISLPEQMQLPEQVRAWMANY